MPSVAVNGVTIEYDVRGEGEPLLLVMGLAGQLTDWPDEFVGLFIERGYRVIRFDNRDIGLSTQTAGKPPSRWKLLLAAIFRRKLKSTEYTLTDMANDAAGLLDALDVERTHVVGVSMGGMIAQELAIEHPDKVMSLCSIMSNTGDRKNGGTAASLIRDIGLPKPAARETALEQQVVLFRAISGPHFDEEAFRPYAQASIDRSFTPAGIARQSGAIAGSRDRTELLAKVTAPTLVIHGLVDPLVKLSGGIATAQAIPGSRLLAFGDMGHDLPRPRWHEIRDAIVRNAARAVPTTRVDG